MTLNKACRYFAFVLAVIGGFQVLGSFTPLLSRMDDILDRYARLTNPTSFDLLMIALNGTARSGTTFLMALLFWHIPQIRLLLPPLPETEKDEENP